MDPFLPFVLKFLRLYRGFKYLCILSTLVMIVISGLQTYQFYHNPGIKTFLKYGTVYIGSIYGICINIIYMRVAHSVNKFISSMKFKSLFSVNTVNVLDMTDTKIKALISKTNIVLVMWLTSAICGVEIIFYNAMSNLDETTLISVLLRPKIKSMLVARSIEYAVFIGANSISISCTVPMYLIYLIFYLKLNLIILTDQVKRFKPDLNRADAPGFMKSKQVIKFITEEYLRINRFNLYITSKLQIDCILFICSGFLVGFMGCFSIFSSNRSIIVATAIFTAYVSYGVTICAYMQSYEDDSVDLYHAILDLNWYKWNVNCQKMYLLLVTNTYEIMHIKLFWVVDINHDLLKRIARITYAAVNFFYSIG